MKTRIVTLKVEMPQSEAALIDGLTIENDGPLKQQEHLLVAARSELERMQRKRADAVARKETLAVEVPEGRGTLEELQSTVAALVALDLVLPRYEQRVREAEAALARETRAAKERLTTQGAARLEILRRAAQMVAPLLEEIRDLEMALERVAPGQPWVEWPMSQHDTVVSASWQRAATAPAAPNPPAA